MSLHLHRSQRADQLATALGLMLKTPPADVFASEFVVVPTRGIERWLTQRLSHDLGSTPGGADGVCAGVEFLLPWQLTRHLLGVQRWDAWSPDRLIWPLLQEIDAALGQPWLATLATHLGSDGKTLQDQHRRGRRYAVARRLAGLFDSYASYRPKMLQAWAIGLNHDGHGLALASDLQWQPELWRRVRARIPAPDPATALTEWTRQFVDRATAVPVPDRVSYFGPTRMTARDLHIVGTLSKRSQVHLWLPNPSADLWQRLTESLTTNRPDERERPVVELDRRRADRTILLPRNRLLSALGRDSRELQIAIAAIDKAAVVASSVVIADVMEQARPSLLHHLQRVIGADQPAGGVASLVLDPADRSIQVHACHGPIRQVEVLREVIVGLLADDHTLQPRDILVMCPDIEQYTPLIAATFGLSEVVPDAHPGQRLRVSVADRSVTRTNPVVASLQRVLTLADGRAGATEILDLAAMAPVRARFAFSADDLELLARWTGQAAVRWGLDPQHRSSFQMDNIVQGTWRSGLDRILLGVTMADEGKNWLSVALPVDDVASTDIELAGRFGQFLDAVTSSVRALAGAHSIRRWSEILRVLVDQLTEVPESDQWQRDQVNGLLFDFVAEADTYAETTEMTVTDIRQFLTGRLGPRPTRGNFRTGGLTFCTMLPMRSVPQRVICLLGLDDGVFPRAARQDGDDVLARDPIVGERDVRGEDRQLMLDALLAAQDAIVIIYSGSDERTGVDRPPAVPVGELLDTVDEIAVTTASSSVRQQILIKHPLQPFDQRNFLGSKPFSFDRRAWSAAMVGETATEPAPFLTARLPPVAIQDIDLVKMVRLLQHPAAGFLEQRLQIAGTDQPNLTLDLMPVELDSLQRWEIGQHLLTGRLAGDDIATCRQREYRRGLLPPGPLGSTILDEILYDIEALMQASAPLRDRYPRSATVIANLDDGREVRGTVSVTNQAILTITYSKLSALHRLRTWIELVALTAAQPDAGFAGITIGRGSTGRAQQFTIAPMSADAAADTLQQLVQLYDAGLREPLPMAARTSCAYASARRDGNLADARQAAELSWNSGRFPGENADPANVKVWGIDASLDSLTRAPGGPPEPTLFGELAMRLWLPLLEAEQVQWL